MTRATFSKTAGSPPCWGGPVAMVCLLAMFLALAGPSWAGGGLSLDVVETDSGRVVHSLPIQPGEDFTLWFLHSYDRAFFAEHYRALAPGRILLTHMTFKSNLNGGGFEYPNFHLRKDGVGELLDINEIRGEVHFMMGSPDMANHTLILRDQRTPLTRYVSPGTLVSLRVNRAAPAKTGVEQ